MELFGTQVEFPAINKVSFFKVIESLEQMAASKDTNVAKYSKNLLKDLGDKKPLIDGIEDYKTLEKYREKIDMIMPMIIPPALTLNEIKGVSPPFIFKPFYTSERFSNILSNAGKGFRIEPKGLNKDRIYMLGCTIILMMYYKFPAGISRPITLEIPNKKTGEMRHYRVAFNADMMEVLPTERSIEISEEDFKELMNDHDNIDLWKKKFPPNSWIMRGVGVMNLMDITIEQSINSIRANLLRREKGTFAKVAKNLGTMLNIKDLKVGFLSLENGKFTRPPKDDMSFIMLNKADHVDAKGALCKMGNKKLLELNEPFVLSDVKHYNELANNFLSNSLVDQGLESYIVIPVVHEDKLGGFLELGSHKKYELNSATLELLDEILPTIAMASARFQEEAHNRMEAIIQSECTTIHSSVKWRFEEAALQYMREEEAGGDPVIDDIIFKDVYPLYGQTDIKSSSSIRNTAVQADLGAQLYDVKNIFELALKQEILPVYEELMFQLKNCLDELEDSLLAGSEHRILNFLRHDIYPVFEHLKTLGGKVAKAINKFEDRLHPELHMIYEKRRDFDESVGRINQTLAQVIDKRQEAAQEMYPHYFERYKTDGVEYNIYIGASISKEQQYHPVFLRNLQLWQLITTCEMERAFNELQPKLGTPLEVASLILVYTTPLAVHFRSDEKRFDVEGAYNARYEIIKKRVDKAHIKGTDERITQPGKIAIIYSSREDAEDYRRYLEFLEAKGYLVAGSTEDVELEDLQGITGLRALRVTVDYDSGSEENISMDELMAAIKAN